MCLCDCYREDGLQFFPVDFAVAVLVEQLEVPLQFLVDFSFQHQTDGGDVLHKVDVTVLQTEERDRKSSRGWWVTLICFLLLEAET